MNIQLDKTLCSDATELYQSLGLTLESAINVFLTKSLEAQGFPFEVRRGPQKRTAVTSKQVPEISNDEITSTIRRLVESSLSEEEIQLLQDLKYSKQTFGISFPVLRVSQSDHETDIRAAAVDDRGYNRYSTRKKKIANKDGKVYLVCTQWLDQHREPFIRWRQRFEH